MRPSAQPVHLFYRTALAMTSALMLGILSPGPKSVQAQVSEQLCLADYGISENDCTSNDVEIALVAVDLPAVADCLDSPFGTASARFLTSVYSQGGASRYDLAVWISKNGIDPRNGLALCHHEYFHPNTGTPNPTNPTGAGPFRELEMGSKADICGDAEDEQPGNNTIVDAIFKSEAVDIQCIDSNDDGEVDYIGCVSWDNNSEQDTCDSVAEALPGTTAKCRCTGFDTGLLMPPRIEIEKTVASIDLVSSMGGQFTYDVVYEIRVQNTGLLDIEDIQVMDDLDATFATATSWSFTSAQLLAAKSDFSEGGSITFNSSYDGETDVNLVDDAFTRRLNYDDTLPTSDQGDYVTFEVAASFTTSCSASYDNVSTVTGNTVLTSQTLTEPPSTLSSQVSVGCTPTAAGLTDFSARTSRSVPRNAWLVALTLVALAGSTFNKRRKAQTRT